MEQATVKQVAFIKRLYNECSQDSTPFLASTPTLKDASNEISRLLAITPGLDLSSLPSGHYAADQDGKLQFFKVDNIKNESSRWYGWIFVKEQSSNYYTKVGAQRPAQKYHGEAAKALASIVQAPKEAAVRYGQELGVCGVCGRTLTDPDSIAKGIGPVCEKRF